MIAQEVQQKILAEHYTNTKCGICAAKNPAFFSLLENYDEVHLAYYPSSPFSSCIFSMHNATEADGRTNYYSIFGGTPRVVLNGEVVPLASVMLQESRIDAEVPNMTPFTIDVSQVYEDANNVTVNITVNTVAMTSITDLTLHVMLAEKLIEYNAPNGENEHPNVFRKALYGLGGESFTVPANGSSSNFETSYTFDPDWIKEDMEIIVFIQDESDKTVKQAAITPKIGTFNAGTPSAIKSLDDLNLSVYPNPVLNELNILGLNLKNTNYTITNIIGKEMKNGTISSNKIDVSLFEKGIYILKISKEEQNYYTKFYKN